ncbi:hypothetical protein [Shewanella aegiceratis]|uniref:hypothetical protein n=1 Tax=Shewanella aegiceratis TaxID=2864203 RepID=UPI001C658DCC|nr:hypothetical protein [Shewanella aegiceratis]QYJ83083.1 hypothetical protein K0H80_03395 [Shewanella aegiceratis]
MKKALVAAAILAIGAGGYWAMQQTPKSVDNQVLAYVPADTPLFSAQFEPFPIKDYIDALPEAQKQYPVEMKTLLSEDDDPRAQFIFRVLERYFDASKDGQQLIDTFGLPEKITSYFYTLGVLPVIKLDIANPDHLWAVLDKAEVESGLTHTAKQLGEVKYRAYSLTDEGENERVDLVFAIDKGMLTLTLETSFLEPELLETALGLKPVQDSLAKAGTVDEIIKKHGFKKDSVSYINHQELVKAITTLDANQMARQLTKIFKLIHDDPFVELRSQACQSELAGIAANWPRTVIGYTDFEVKNKRAKIGFSTVIESNNQVILGALSQMRGFIPAHTKRIDAGVFSMALGLDVNQFVPSISKIWDDLLTPSYQCEPLAQLQGEMEGQSPAMLGMFTGMANGVKGVSFSLLDYALEQDTQEISLKDLDAIATLTADDPATLFNMVKPFAPELANVNLPSDGSTVDLGAALQLPPSLGVRAQMALKGQHLTIYTGDKSQAIADKLADEKPTANGLFSMTADYAKLFTPAMNLMAMSGEPIPEELEALKDYRTQLKVGMDINAKGIVIDSLVETRND